MKKIILCAVAANLALATLAQLRAGTDVFSVQSLVDAGIQVPSESSQEFVSPATGTSYVISSISDNDGKLYFNSSLGIKNTDAHCYLEEVCIVDPDINQWGATGFTVYAANEPISNSPFMQAGVKTLTFDNETLTAFADQPYTYVAIWCFQGSASAVEIKWSDDAPVAETERPYIILNSELGCPSGSTVTIASDTEVARIEVKVSKGDVVLFEDTLGNPCEITLEGEVGEKISVEARAVADGLDPSKWIKRVYTITNPMLMEPEFSVSSYSGSVIFGDNICITNPNAEGSTLNYSVNGGASVSTTDNSVLVAVEGNIGDVWTLSAWCTRDGYEDSEVTEWEGTINTNVCPAPYFSMQPGVYAAGTEIGIAASYPAQSITYRINGGEWIEAPATQNVYVALEDDMTIEAYSSAAFPYVDSEIVVGSFSLEKLTENIDVITSAMFGETEMGQMETYTSESTSNGAVYTFTGYEFYDGGMFINGNGNIATLSSSFPIKRMKIETSFDNQLIIYLSDDRIKAPSKYLACFTVIDGDFDSGEWFEIKSTEGEPPFTHFYITTTEESMANVIDRVLVEYEIPTAVSCIDSENTDCDFYDLTGCRVKNPAAGVFIRVKDGKTSKVVLK